MVPLSSFPFFSLNPSPSTLSLSRFLFLTTAMSAIKANLISEALKEEELSPHQLMPFAMDAAEAPPLNLFSSSHTDIELSKFSEQNLQQSHELFSPQAKKCSDNISSDQPSETISNAPIKWMSSKMRLMRKMMAQEQITVNKSIGKIEAVLHQEIRRGNISPSGTEIRVCSFCSTTKTPLWRSGPQGPKAYMSSPLHFLPSKPPQNPNLSPSQSKWSGLRKLRRPLPSHPITLTLIPNPPFALSSHLKPLPFPPIHRQPTPLSNHSSSSSTAVAAGRSKKKPGGPSPGRIEGSAELRRAAKENARRRSRRMSQNRFFRRSRAAAEQADSFTEDELEMIGLGYDRAVRFMSKDHPMLRHPYDWYKYGRYGPYSWRGIVVGPPIRGRFTDERVTIISEVRDHEEFEKIEQFEMANEYSRRVLDLNPSVGLRHYWVFVRHPKWRATELPWQQWTLVSEVAVEASKKEWIDKWSLMGRLGNKSRADVTQCAAWMRPDIIYVKKPLYQCRFEPQDEFFKQLWPLLDPNTENQFKFELRREENGRVFVEDCTYFAGLCKIVKISPKAYVDDVVNAYQRLSDEAKSRCLEFLLRNHPVELLHPYTKEWKAKLEELELGCDAPDESDDDGGGNVGEATEWIEDEEEEEGEEEEEDYVIEASDGGDDEVERDEEEEVVADPEETQEYWDEQWEKALRSSEAMEELVKKRLDASDKRYKKQMEEESNESSRGDVDAELEQIKAEWKREEFRWARRKVRKEKLAPELFLKSAVRPFTYRNLVKEIVLLRHAIVDGDVSLKT